MQHLFTVNGVQHNVTHVAAGTLFGCADQVRWWLLAKRMCCLAAWVGQAASLM